MGRSTAPHSDTISFDGLCHTSAAGRLRSSTSSTTRLLARWGGGSTESVISLALFNQFVAAWSQTRTWRPMPMTSRCWLLVPASWRLRRGRTNSVQLWWGRQMGSNWPLPDWIPTWRRSPRIPTSPGSTHKCESETRWPRRTEPVEYFVPHLCRNSRPWLCQASFEGSQRHESLNWI